MASTTSTGGHGDKDDDLYCRRMYTELKARARAAHAAFRAAGIPDPVYHDTIGDIDVWAEDYFRQHGHYGIKEVAWIEKSLAMKVFKLGRLQFERLDGEAASAWITAAQGNGTSLVLSTHVQAGTPLDPGACEESYQAAWPFYTALGFAFDAILFVCESWLLNPLLHELLPPGSNILAFQGKYTILSHHPGNRQMEQRVFGTLMDNPSDYPDDNRLRRHLRKALLAGRPAGTCKGCFRITGAHRNTHPSSPAAA